MRDKKTGMEVVCRNCWLPTYKTKTEIERSITGVFFCSKICQENAHRNQLLANNLEIEWLA